MSIAEEIESQRRAIALSCGDYLPSRSEVATVLAAERLRQCAEILERGKADDAQRLLDECVALFRVVRPDV